MTSEAKQSGRFKAWLQLLRAPNLLTVPGDPMVGFCIGVPGVVQRANGSAMWVTVVLSLLVYAAGLIHNDLCDLEEDRRDRPNRPLASGVISTRAAWGVFASLIFAALAIGVFATGELHVDWCGKRIVWDNTPKVMCVLVGLILCILLYNRWLKHVKIIGPVAMGACRGLSMLLGMAAITDAIGPMWKIILVFGIMGAIWGSYIVAISFVAVDETEKKRRCFRRFLPILMPLGLLIYFLTQTSPEPGAMTLLSVAVIFAARPIWALRGVSQPKDVQKQIGWLISNLIILQAAVIMEATSQTEMLLCGLLLLLWPLNIVLAKRFYAS